MKVVFFMSLILSCSLANASAINWRVTCAAPNNIGTYNIESDDTGDGEKVTSFIVTKDDGQPHMISDCAPTAEQTVPGIFTYKCVAPENHDFITWAHIPRSVMQGATKGPFTVSWNGVFGISSTLQDCAMAFHPGS